MEDELLCPRGGWGVRGGAVGSWAVERDGMGHGREPCCSQLLLERTADPTRQYTWIVGRIFVDRFCRRFGLFADTSMRLAEGHSGRGRRRLLPAQAQLYGTC